MELNTRAVKIAMLDKNLTNKSLADAIGVHPATVAKWLNEPTRPQLEDVQRMAAVLGLKDSEIVTQQD